MLHLKVIKVLDVTETGRPNMWHWASVNGSLVNMFRSVVDVNMNLNENRPFSSTLVVSFIRPIQIVVLGPCRTTMVNALEKHYSGRWTSVSLGRTLLTTGDSYVQVKPNS